MRDNQNADLTAAKKRLATDKLHHDQGYAKMIARQEETVYADWTEVEGCLVLRVADSKFVAQPLTGRKTARKFDVINLDTREYVCQLNKSEVYGWLLRAAE